MGKLTTLLLLVALACFGQGKKNVVETGTINAASSNRIPPTYTFASPPSSPPTGAVYIFTDALTPGAAVGGGSSLTTCRWSGSAWVAVGGLGTQYKIVTCQTGLGDGFNAIPANTYLQTSCLNEFGVTWTITSIKCYTDNSGTSTLAVTNGAGTALLSGAVTCTNSFAAGTQSGTTTIASTDYAKFTFVADGTSKQSTWIVTGTR